MDFRILGPLEVAHDGRAVPVTGTRQRELLALLLLDAGRVVSSDRLMEELWGANQPAAGSTALRVRVSQLWKVVKSGAPVVVGVKFIAVARCRCRCSRGRRGRSARRRSGSRSCGGFTDAPASADA